MKHTSGPWHYEELENACLIANNANPPIAQVYKRSMWINDKRRARKSIFDEEGIANARLIAVAPDMLEVLRNVVNRLLMVPENELTGTEQLLLREASIVIAKAEGREIELD